jgi:gliding motility-associated-like protein
MRVLIITILLTLFSFGSKASHIVGGDIYYDYLGNNSYRFYISVYRDCNSTGAQFDSPLQLAVYSGTNLVQNVAVPFPGSQNLPVVFNNPCVTPPNNICIEKAEYEVVVNLPPINGGYTISYQRCCRGPNITNLMNPDDTGFTLTCRIPGLDTGNWENSSPRFTNYPPLLLCNNEDLIFDHSATDPDGDQLIYSLVTPNSGASSFNPAPNPAPPPAYPPVVWAGGFSAQDPLGPGATINIDQNTGLLTADPQMLGLFVVGVRVQELRNGVLINETVRDFLFRVFNCQLQLEAIVPNQEQFPGFVNFCQGLAIQFPNNSYGGTNYEWDFGVPGTNTDVSTLFSPSFTYPAPGNYEAMLVVNPGWPCTDTTFVDIYVNNELETSFTSNDSLCIFGNSFNFIATSTGPPTTEYNWSFGQQANIQSTAGQTVNGIEFSATGNIPITLTAIDGQCEAEYIGSVYIFPEPISNMTLPDNIECEGLTINFADNSVNANNYEWDFDGTGSSTDQTPSHTFPAPGTYDITLISGSTSTCKDTVVETIALYEELFVTFNTQDSMCVMGNSFDFDGTVSGPTGSSFAYNFGPNASISSSTDVDVNDVSFNTTGDVTISLTGSFLTCTETHSEQIYLYSPPTIDFGLAPGRQCAPFNAQFIDMSSAETPIAYQWNFGDGSSSGLQNPSHLYPTPGNYPVTLTITTSAGCIDTLSLLQADLINVRPSPVAGFDVTPDYTDICNSVITFIDESQDATKYTYIYGDGTEYTGPDSPAHLYLTAGTHYPIQIVENEWGCSDTATNQLFIEPFNLYIPNTFTPDGDEFNNVFQPQVYLEIFQWNMKIYNRWGQLLFETNDFNTGWDGTISNGRFAQDGLYIYKINYQTCEPNQPSYEITGHVNMLR